MGPWHVLASSGSERAASGSGNGTKSSNCARRVEATGWHKCPWRWTIGCNSKGTGLADKFGYGFRSEKIGDEVRYFLTPTAKEAA
jgi:hypothetical protein